MKQLGAQVALLTAMVVASSAVNARTVSVSYAGQVSSISVLVSGSDDVFPEPVDFDPAEFSVGDAFRLSMMVRERPVGEADSSSPRAATYRSSPAAYEASVGSFAVSGDLADFSLVSAGQEDFFDSAISVDIDPQRGHLSKGDGRVSGLTFDILTMSSTVSFGDPLVDGLNLSTTPGRHLAAAQCGRRHGACLPAARARSAN